MIFVGRNVARPGTKKIQVLRAWKLEFVHTICGNKHNVMHNDNLHLLVQLEVTECECVCFLCVLNS